jgi:hypothetical protein
MRELFTTLLTAAFFAAFGAAGLETAPAWAADRPPAIKGEGELTQGVRSGRLGRDELVRRGQELSYFQKLRLYYYAQKLGPYFEGVEEAIRELARTSPGQADKLDANRLLLYQAMVRARRKLAAAQRPEFELEWRRGLTGLIYLDFDWRQRIAEQKKAEIKNPYDLVALLDCLDARLRGLESGGIKDCPANAPLPTTARKDES